MQEISEGMKALGLVRMSWRGVGYEDSTSRRIGRFGVWEVHPANVIVWGNGLVVPVDVIITELPALYETISHPMKIKALKRYEEHRRWICQRLWSSTGP